MPRRKSTFFVMACVNEEEDLWTTIGGPLATRDIAWAWAKANPMDDEMVLCVVADLGDRKRARVVDNPKHVLEDV